MGFAKTAEETASLGSKKMLCRSTNVKKNSSLLYSREGRLKFTQTNGSVRQKQITENLQMTSRTVFLKLIAIGLLAIYQPAFAGDTDGADFLAWQRGFGFAPTESAEVLINHCDASSEQDTVFNFVFTNNNGIVIGLFKTTIPASDPRNPTRDHGFGFVTIDVAASSAGELLINGETYGYLTANPRTGRYALGISLLSSQAPGRNGRNAPSGDSTITIVSADGTTAANLQQDDFELTKCQLTLPDL